MVACGYISVHLLRRPNIDAVHVVQAGGLVFSQCLMVAKILVGMLCTHLLCFSLMFLLISQRLRPRKMGMDFFAMGNFLLGSAYVLQLVEGGPAWSAMSVLNHTLTLASPVAYWLGAMRFFGQPVPLLRPLLAFAAIYSTMQVLVQWSLGPVARYAMLSGMAALLFFGMVLTVIYGVRTFAKDLYGEMVFFAVLVSGICVLNVIKFFKLLTGGLDALQMDHSFQLAFYIYMSFLATVLPPSIVWLVLRRLSDDLRNIAARDPLTQLLNRRGLNEALQHCFRSRKAEPAHLLIADVDHFKRINDSYGHQAGDAVLCQVAKVLQGTVRPGDLVGRIGGEEFVVISQGGRCGQCHAIGRAPACSHRDADHSHHGAGPNAAMYGHHWRLPWLQAGCGAGWSHAPGRCRSVQRKGCGAQPSGGGSGGL